MNGSFHCILSDPDVTLSENWGLVGRSGMHSIAFSGIGSLLYSGFTIIPTRIGALGFLSAFVYLLSKEILQNRNWSSNTKNLLSWTFVVLTAAAILGATCSFLPLHIKICYLVFVILGCKGALWYKQAMDGPDFDSLTSLEALII